MEQKVTIYFKDRMCSELILHRVDSVSVENEVLKVTKNNDFCYVIPLDNIVYSVTEAED